MLLLRRHLLPHLRAVSPLPSPIHHRACLLSTSTSASAAPFSLEDYLVASCGLAPTQARETAQKAFDGTSKAQKKAFEELSYSRLNSASNPDAVLALLSSVGLSRADIAAVVVADPLLLRSSPKNIGPRLLALRDRLGLSTPQIFHFLLVGSHSLYNCDVVPRLEFFISLLGSFEKLLVAMKRNNRILRSDLERVTKPNIALLRQCGVSAQQIAQLHPRVLGFNPERMKELVLHAERLGVPRSSRIFWQAVTVVAQISEEKVAARLVFLNSALGCQENEVAAAVSKMPRILGVSEEYLRRKIQFLIKEVLLAKGLLDSNRSFYSLVSCGGETFKLRYIDCHKDSVPGLADAYATACDGVSGKAYHKCFKHLLEDISAHVTADFHKLLVPLVSAYHYDGPEVNTWLAHSEAKILHEEIHHKAYSGDEVIRILTRSKAQLLATFNYYNDAFGHPINKMHTYLIN
ncbi:unnamed protein product [Urochloa decumbens]|uniref:Uncharacterized protein n=1 Tax=Urochloa decumbens TaxID=240449 RepID=A0ABC9E7U6_9POAL